MPLRYAPQGGWIFIDGTIEPLSAAYSIGFATCIPFGFICFDTNRLAFCHLDHPGRLDMLAEAMIWVCKQDRRNLDSLVYFMDPDTWTGAKKEIVINAIRQKINKTPKAQPLGRGQAAGLALDGRPLNDPEIYGASGGTAPVRDRFNEAHDGGDMPDWKTSIEDTAAKGYVAYISGPGYMPPGRAMMARSMLGNFIMAPPAVLQRAGARTPLRYSSPGRSSATAASGTPTRNASPAGRRFTTPKRYY